MSAIQAPLPSIETLADLVERLGGLPLKRILWHPLPGTATEEDVWRELEGPRKRVCELVDGMLVEKAMGWEESSFAGILIGWLNAFVVPRNSGIVTGEAGFYRLFPHMLRAPDIAFVSWDRLPGRQRVGTGANGARCREWLRPALPGASGSSSFGGSGGDVGPFGETAQRKRCRVERSLLSVRIARVLGNVEEHELARDILDAERF